MVERRMLFAGFENEMRTDDQFRNRIQPIHHKEKSILEDLTNIDGTPLIDMIKQFPTSDPLHLLEEGVMKRVLKIWMKGTKTYKKKWSTDMHASINRNILQWNKELPNEIHRKIRDLKYVSYWKATEFRTMLLYYGIVAFKDILNEVEYTHFLQLCLAIRMCSCQNYVSKYCKSAVKIPQKLLSEYCKNFVKIYGNSSVVSNIHNIAHIYDDVEKFGSLIEISTYPFENFLKDIKMRIKPSNTPIEQITRRLAELSFDLSENTQVDIDMRNWKKRVWVPEMKYEFQLIANNVHGQLSNKSAFKFIRITPNIYFSTKKIGDRWFLTKSNQIVQMNYAIRLRDSYVISGAPIKHKTDFFKQPYASHLTDIFVSNGDKDETKIFDVNEIRAKLMCLSYKTSYVFIPLLHSIDECSNYYR